MRRMTWIKIWMILTYLACTSIIEAARVTIPEEREGDNVTYEVLTDNQTDLSNGTEESENEPTAAEKTYKTFKHYVDHIGLPLLLFLGTAGNITSFIIYSRNAFRNSVTSLYFRVLAVADTLILNVGLWQPWIRLLNGGEDPYELTHALCKIRFFFLYFLHDFAVWILVLVALERAIGVYIPHKARLVCTKTKAIISIVTLFFVLAGINSPVFIYFGLYTGYDKPICSHLDNYTYEATVIVPYVDLMKYCVIPFFMLLSCNIFIVILLCKRSAEFNTDTSGKHLMSMTVVLVSVVCAYLFCNFPWAVFSIVNAHTMLDETNPLAYLYLRTFAVLGRYINNSINFLLYALTGRPFRVELRAMCCCQPSTPRRYNSVSTGMSSISRTEDVKYEEDGL